jgi:hypothetical protein
MDLCGLNEFVSLLAYIEFTALILFTGLNIRSGVLWLMLQIFDWVRPVVQSSSSYHHTILIHEPNIITITLQPNEQLHMLRVNELWHIVQDHSGKWQIGLVIEVVDWENDIIFCVDVLVDVRAFYQFPMEAAKSYLIGVAEEDANSVVLAADLRHNIRVNGLRDLPDSPLIIKTYWIRIIQRRWQRVYSERMRLLKLRGGLKAQRQFELCGNYGGGSGDGLRGMLFQSQQI